MERHDDTNNRESSRDDDRDDVEKLLSKNKKEPYKLLLQNIRRLVTQNTKKKIKYFEEYVIENNILAINFTETWLNESITEDINIKGYQIFRCDRKGREGGGVAIYLKDDYEAKKLIEMNSGGCEMVAIFSEKLNTINIVLYRPPDTKYLDFIKILTGINTILSEMSTPEPAVIISGDFNFPFVKWIKGAQYGCRCEVNNSGSTIDERYQFYKLLEVFDNYNLVQTIDEPTRNENTLDLIFTNDINTFTNIDIHKSCLSDHHQIEVTTNYKINNRHINSEPPKYSGETEFWQLNFHSDNISWDTINKEIGKIPWKTLFSEKDTETCTYIFLRCLLNICMEIIPRKTTNGKSKIPRERNY